MKACIFCDIIAGRASRTLIYEDDKTVVIKDIYPQAPVHLLVIPKVHVVEFTDLTPQQITELGVVVQTIIKRRRITNYRIHNRGGGAQEIDHVHIHIMGSAS